MSDNGHSPLWARLESVDQAYQALAAERDQARAERDKARTDMKDLVDALAPLMAQVMRFAGESGIEIAREEVAQPAPVAKPKEMQRRAPRAPRSRLTPENETQRVADWTLRHQAGESLSAIAASDGVHFETVRIALERAGIPVRYQRRAKGQAQQMPAMAGRCIECGMAFDSPSLKVEGIKPPLNGVCGGCQDSEEWLAQRREGAQR